MAPEYELTRLEREELKKNETPNFLLSRLDHGGKIQARNALRLNITRWVTAIKLNDEVPTRVPEFLFRVLVNFVTAEKAKEIQDIQNPVTSTGSDQWLAKLRVLLAENPDERLLQVLNRMPDRMVWCHDITPNEENSQILVYDANDDERYHRKLRDIIRRRDREGMMDNTGAFYSTGATAWTIRAPYWHVALATDAEGNRFLREVELRRVLPDWRQILNGEKVPSSRYPMAGGRLRKWLGAEQRKASRLGKTWPGRQRSASPAPAEAVSAAVPSSKGPSTFPSSLPSGGHTHPSPPGTEHLDQAEETSLLGQISTEIKELEKTFGDATEARMPEPVAQTPLVTEPMMSSDQVYGPGDQGPHGVPQAAQAINPGAQAALPDPPEAHYLPQDPGVPEVQPQWPNQADPQQSFEPSSIEGRLLYWLTRPEGN